MPEYGGEVEFQAHLSFAEGAINTEPTTSPPAPLGSVGAPVFAEAHAGRSYRAIAARSNPIDPEALPSPGTYFVTTDYDVAMADLAYNLNVRSAINIMRKGDLIRVGSFKDPTGRVRGVYQLRVAPAGGLTGGTPDDVAGSLVNLTMTRVNPNLPAP